MTRYTVDDKAVTDLGDLIADSLPANLIALNLLDSQLVVLATWDGMMQILDRIYPEPNFPTAADDPDRDIGPRLISALRRIDQAEKRAAAAEAELEQLQAPIEGILKLNVEELAQALNTQRFNRRMSWKQVAAEAGVSPSTLTRLTQGKRPDADGLLRLLNWLGHLRRLPNYVRT